MIKEQEQEWLWKFVVFKILLLHYLYFPGGLCIRYFGENMQMEEHMYRTLYCISLIRTINLDLIREMQKGVSVESVVIQFF